MTIRQRLVLFKKYITKDIVFKNHEVEYLTSFIKSLSPSDLQYCVAQEINFLSNLASKQLNKIVLNNKFKNK